MWKINRQLTKLIHQLTHKKNNYFWEYNYEFARKTPKKQKNSRTPKSIESKNTLTTLYTVILLEIVENTATHGLCNGMFKSGLQGIFDMKVFNVLYDKN
jgi:hypothetical protein